MIVPSTLPFPPNVSFGRRTISCEMTEQQGPYLLRHVKEKA